MLEKKHQRNYHCAYGYEMNSKTEYLCVYVCVFPLLQLVMHIQLSPT